MLDYESNFPMLQALATSVKPVFDYLTTGCYSAITVPDTEIPEIPLRFLIKKVDIHVAM